MNQDSVKQVKRVSSFLCLVLTLAMFTLVAGFAIQAKTGPDVSKDVSDCNHVKTPNVVIFAIDTLRADHVSCLGKQDIATPHMDALAKDGILFSHAHATAPWTLPSFASVITGLIPYRHGALGDKDQRLSEQIETLAVHLAKSGYRTRAWVTIQFLGKAFGMDRGYEQFEHFEHSDKDSAYQANQVTQGAIQWFDSVRKNDLEPRQPVSQKQPFFAFLHYFDVHAPYTPPAPFDRMYYKGDAHAPGLSPLTDLLFSSKNRAEPVGDNKDMYNWLQDVTDIQYPIKQYAAGVSYVDYHIGKVVDALKQLGLYDNTLIVLLADHGEHLTEHDIYFTHKEPFQETLRIPLIWKMPNQHHASTIVQQPVSLVDVMPTILEICDCNVPKDLDGRSLVGALQGGKCVRPFVVAEFGAGEHDFSKALIQWPWKLMLFKKDSSYDYRLYHLKKDPGELTNLIAAKTQIAKAMKHALWTVFSKDTPIMEARNARRVELDNKTLQELESLGYALP